MKKTSDTSIRRTGYMTFFLSGLCAISSGVAVSLLRDQYGFSFAFTGTLLSAMSIGSVIAGFVCGMTSSKFGIRRSILILALGYPLGYAMMSIFGIPGLLLAAFLLVGFSKGSVINTCTILVGNHTPNKSRSMTLMHSCYAAGALLCPFLISAFAGVSTNFALLAVAFGGIVLWAVYFVRLPSNSAVLEGSAQTDASSEEGTSSRFGFLRSVDFWILTILLFSQNAAEQSVNGWVVTYFKDNGILTGKLAAYTISIMWGATLCGRLLIAFALKIKNVFRALSIMGLGCTVLYIVLVQQTSAIPAAVSLFLFAFAMSGVNPLAVAAVGSDLSPASAGVLLPISNVGAIVMPYIIGALADSFGLNAGMRSNIVPCVGIMVLSFIMYLRRRPAAHRQ